MLLKNINNNNIIFVHIPKTGGGSLENILLRNKFKEEDIQEERKNIHSYKRKWTQHSCIKDIIERYSIQNAHHYFKFAFVRNPWDRIVSEYMYVKNHGGCACRGNIRKMPKNFEEYIMNNFKCSWREHVSDQYSFIHNSSGEKMVDFVGRFENYQEDVDKVMSRIGIRNYELPNINQTRNLKQRIIKPYWLYYNNNTRKIVEQKYKRDIEAFNYEFEEL